MHSVSEVLQTERFGPIDRHSVTNANDVDRKKRRPSYTLLAAHNYVRRSGRPSAAPGGQASVTGASRQPLVTAITLTDYSGPRCSRPVRLTVITSQLLLLLLP